MRQGIAAAVSAAHRGSTNGEAGLTETESGARRAGAGARPSLLPDAGDDSLPSGSGAPSRPAMRMLDGLDEGRHSSRSPSRRGLGLFVAAVAACSVLGAGWWASAFRETVPDRVASAPMRRAVEEPAAAPTRPVARESAAEATRPASQDPASDTPARSPVSAPEPRVARIESVPAGPAERPRDAATTATATAAAGVAAATPSVARERPADGAALPRSDPERHARGTSATRRDERLARRRQEIERRADARPASRPQADGPRPATAGDPDVALLSALLTRLSSENGAASPSTLARFVEQCESRQIGNAIDAFECRRRICAGYWGKAEACPLALAPRAH